MAARAMCGRCGIQRRKPGEDLCPVCWLLQALRDEHRDGDHLGSPNPSCALCQPDLNKRLLDIFKRDNPDKARDRGLLDEKSEESDKSHKKAKSTKISHVSRKATPVPVSRETSQDSRHTPMSHANCDHPRTPKARAACRAAMRKGTAK